MTPGVSSFQTIEDTGRDQPFHHQEDKGRVGKTPPAEIEHKIVNLLSAAAGGLEFG